MGETERIQVVLPRKLAGQMRKRVPARTRSAWIAEAIQDSLMAERRLEACDRAFGAWSEADFPGLGAAEDIAAWRRLCGQEEPGTTPTAPPARKRRAALCLITDRLELSSAEGAADGGPRLFRAVARRATCLRADCAELLLGMRGKLAARRWRCCESTAYRGARRRSSGGATRGSIAAPTLESCPTCSSRRRP
jgi:hypothetical protein